MDNSLEENDDEVQAISPREREGSTTNALFAAAAKLKEKGKL